MKKVVSVLVCLAMSFCMNAAIAKKAPKADNTAQNKGATQDEAVTADKQSNKKSDVEALAEIRKAVVADNDLSTDAKNVKILYSKGKVTLRGPVVSESEKTRVEELAKSFSFVSSVKNMITVAAK